MKSFLIWTLAIIITLSAAVYQRMTGPSHPFRGDISIESTVIKYRLPRNHSSSSPCEVKISVPDNKITGAINFRRYPANEEWTTVPMQQKDGLLIGHLPEQSPAGKLQYMVILSHADTHVTIGDEEPIIIRYKGDVPMYVLLPHILMMFIAMLLSTLTAFRVVFKLDAKMYAWITFVCLTLGGMILGPIVQKFAFGEFWTGVPFGWDLTDNKTLVAFIGWTIAVLGNWKKDRPYLYIMASVILMAVYLIPHSAMGSELNYETGNIKTG